MNEENEISRIILDCAYKVHTKLGSGLLEKVYRECLAYELKNCGLAVEQEKPFPVIYEDIKMDCGYRVDIIVNNKVIIEKPFATSTQELEKMLNIFNKTSNRLYLSSLSTASLNFKSDFVGFNSSSETGSETDAKIESLLNFAYSKSPVKTFLIDSM